MLALIFAVISLSSIDPDPIVTTAPVMHDRITAASGFAPGSAMPSAGLSSDITVAPACTFGVPQFGRSLWNDAASLARLEQPACAGMGSSAPWLPAFGNGFVRLEPAILRPAGPGFATATSTSPLPARFTAQPGPLSHGPVPPVLHARAGAEPAFARLPAGAPQITRRAH